jgi:transcriptional regulator with XRE-family HTH domain
MTHREETVRMRAARLRQLRKSRGLTHEELAALLGCARSTVATWERTGGLPLPQRLSRLAEILGVQPAELLDDPFETPSLKALRTAAGYRQSDIASMLNVAVGTYSNVERGRQGLPERWIPILAKAFHAENATIRNSARNHPRPSDT